MFRFKPKAGTLHFRYRLSAEKEGSNWETPTREIYFTADIWQPAKIHLANGRILDLIGRGGGDSTPVWVTLWDSPGSQEVDGSCNFVGVSTDPKQPHIVINIHLEPTRLTEVLRDLRDGNEVSFRVGERHEYMFGKGLHVLGYHQPSWREDGDSLTWRDDLQTGLAIAHVEVCTKLATPEPVIGEEKIEAELESVEVESEKRESELSGSIEALVQSISQLENTTVAAHRLLMSRILWILVLLAVIAIAAWFRH